MDFLKRMRVVMADIRKVLEKEVNGLKVNLLEFDIANDNSFNEIKTYLVNKVKKSKVHNVEEYNLNFYSSANLKPEFIEKFNKQVEKITIPQKAKLPQFDVRRERVTEWLGQFVLEQEYGCRFFDEADKRINLKPVELNKHTDGIDVPGIWMDGDKIRFVVCEVKASESARIPCSSTNLLQEDIQKAIDNAENRVSLEILAYMLGIRNVKIKDDIFEKIVAFLMGLIANEERLADNIFFFPFLIRNNENIVSGKNIDDYKNFTLHGIDKKNVKNIILSFEKDFTDFSTEVYQEAIGE